jgi:serine/threonine protein kinase/tetratricopeptide (TPR) repeat protein
MSEPNAQADGGGSPIERLTAQWLSYPPAPDLAALITAHVRGDAAQLLALVRHDATERLHRGESIRLEFYANAISREMLAPGTALTRMVLGFERMAGALAHEVRERLGEAYSADIDAIFLESLPPTTIGDAAAADNDPTALAPREVRHETSRGWIKGDRIGPFTLRKRLGSGGFGEVWLAEQTAPNLKAAIKVLHPGVGRDVDRLQEAIDLLRTSEGAMPTDAQLAAHLDVSPFELNRIKDDRENVARLRAEAQALAYLKHSHIAAIHQAGECRGLPFIAMEYVEGLPLDRYCDERGLTLEQRLELMACVCEGVQHIHQRGLVHRDLKPENILVTEVIRHPNELHEHERRLVIDQSDSEARVAIPKIVDFGLAKASLETVRLADGTITVDLGKMMGTLEYMAPEQAGHQPLEVDTRADIFSLGVILYQLIAGVVPLDKEQLHKRLIDEVVAIIRRTPRPEPSTRFHQLTDEMKVRIAQLRGELAPDRLDRILHSRIRHLVGTALRLDPADRFSSPAAMGRDIRNYLEERDFVEAAAELRRDIIVRHVKRHRMAYAGAATLLLSLVAGIVVTTAASVRAMRAERKVNQSQQQLVTVTKSVLTIALERPEDAADTSAAFLAKGSVESRIEAAFSQLGDQPPTARAVALYFIGDIRTRLGRFRDAQEPLERSIELFLSDEVNMPIEASRAMATLAEVHHRKQDGEQGLAVSQRALDLLSGLQDPLSEQVLNARENVGHAMKWGGEFDEAQRIYEEVLASRKQAGQNDVQLAETQYDLALVLERGSVEQAEALMSVVYAARSQKGLEDEPAINACVELARMRTKLSRARGAAGDAASASKLLGSAESLYREGIAAAYGVLGGTHWRTLQSEFNLGSMLLTAGQTDEGIMLMRESYQLYWRVGDAQNAIASGGALAGKLEQLERPADALSLLDDIQARASQDPGVQGGFATQLQGLAERANGIRQKHPASAPAGTQPSAG